jgi:ERCC4-type nuclease
MTILCDHREERSGVPDLLRVEHDIDVVPRQLPAGDYVLSDRLVVERKTGADLAASIKNRRLFEQVARLVEAYEAVVVLVEGEPVHIGEASWRGALGRVLLSGVAVLPTDDQDDTADWLARLYRLEGRPAGEPRLRAMPRRPTEDRMQVAEDVLGCLPGVSSVGARRLLEHFGSLAAVFAAGDDELREVAGFGPVRAERLAALFSGSDA